LSEVLLWDQLKGRKMRGHQFMRQKPIGDYVVDFYCSRLRLVIEIDGDSHHGRFSMDAKRHEFLESIGLTVLRFHDTHVKRERKFKEISSLLKDYFFFLGKDSCIINTCLDVFISNRGVFSLNLIIGHSGRKGVKYNKDRNTRSLNTWFPMANSRIYSYSLKQHILVKNIISFGKKAISHQQSAVSNEKEQLLEALKS
jgi:very-short-patch-repair endonuclease